MGCHTMLGHRLASVVWRISVMSVFPGAGIQTLNQIRQIAADWAASAARIELS